MGSREKLLERLVAAQDRLLTCYRTGRQPTGKLLDELADLRSRLAAPASTSSAPSGGDRCERCGEGRMHALHILDPDGGLYHSFRPAKEDHK